MPKKIIITYDDNVEIVDAIQAVAEFIEDSLDGPHFAGAVWKASGHYVVVSAKRGPDDADTFRVGQDDAYIELSAGDTLPVPQDAVLGAGYSHMFIDDPIGEMEGGAS